MHNSMYFILIYIIWPLLLSSDQGHRDQEKVSLHDQTSPCSELKEKF